MLDNVRYASPFFEKFLWRFLYDARSRISDNDFFL